MSRLKKLTVKQFGLFCFNVLTDEQVQVLAQKVVTDSKDEVREFVAILQKYRPNLVRHFFPDMPWTKEEILEIWPQAAEELRGFRSYLEAKSGLTAAQLGIALQLAEEEYKRLKRKK